MITHHAQKAIEKVDPKSRDKLLLFLAAYLDYRQVSTWFPPDSLRYPNNVTAYIILKPNHRVQIVLDNNKYTKRP